MRSAEHLLQVDSRRADAAPADAVEVVAVDQPAERRDAARAVLVDVVERHAGVEAGSPAEPDAVAEPADRLEQAADDATSAARRARGAGRTRSACSPPRSACRSAVVSGGAVGREAVVDELAARDDQLLAVLLVEDGVAESGEALPSASPARRAARRTRHCADRLTTQSRPATSISVGVVIAPASASRRVEVSYRSSRMLTAICRKISRVGVVRAPPAPGRA